MGNRSTTSKASAKAAPTVISPSSFPLVTSPLPLLYDTIRPLPCVSHLPVDIIALIVDFTAPRPLIAIGGCWVYRLPSPTIALPIPRWYQYQAPSSLGGHYQPPVVWVPSSTSNDGYLLVGPSNDTMTAKEAPTTADGNDGPAVDAKSFIRDQIDRWDIATNKWQMRAALTNTGGDQRGSQFVAWNHNEWLQFGGWNSNNELSRTYHCVNTTSMTLTSYVNAFPGCARASGAAVETPNGIVIAGGYIEDIKTKSIICSSSVELWHPQQGTIKSLPSMKIDRVELALVYIQGIGTFAIGEHRPILLLIQVYLIVALICFAFVAPCTRLCPCARTMNRWIFTNSNAFINRTIIRINE
jgi:hypothetical protein